MSFNSLKLELLLKLILNHYFKNCSYQYCRCDYHYLRLLQIDSIKRKKKDSLRD